MLLDPGTWDLLTDARGDWAAAAAPYAVAQDAASEARTFLGEVFYDTTRGVPYQQILGISPAPVEFTRSRINSAAALVPGVVKSRTFFTAFNGRKISGQIQVTDVTGKTVAASF
jgi:hypothetical protein